MAGVSVDLQANRVEIPPARDVVLDLAAVPDAVRRSGFRPGEQRVLARGHVVEAGGSRGFLVQHWPAPLPLEADLPVTDELVLLEARVRVEGGDPVLVDPSIRSAPEGARPQGGGGSGE